MSIMSQRKCTIVLVLVLSLLGPAFAVEYREYIASSVSLPPPPFGKHALPSDCCCSRKQRGAVAIKLACKTSSRHCDPHQSVASSSTLETVACSERAEEAVPERHTQGAQDRGQAPAAGGATCQGLAHGIGQGEPSS